MSRSTRSVQALLFKAPRRPKANTGVELAKWKHLHGVIVYEAKSWTIGDPWLAFFGWPKDDPNGRSFSQLVEQFSFAACERRGLIASGRTAHEACARLAERNELEFI